MHTAPASPETPSAYMVTVLGSGGALAGFEGMVGEGNGVGGGEWGWIGDGGGQQLAELMSLTLYLTLTVTAVA